MTIKTIKTFSFFSFSNDNSSLLINCIPLFLLFVAVSLLRSHPVSSVRSTISNKDSHTGYHRHLHHHRQRNLEVHEVAGEHTWGVICVVGTVLTDAAFRGKACHGCIILWRRLLILLLHLLLRATKSHLSRRSLHAAAGPWHLAGRWKWGLAGFLAVQEILAAAERLQTETKYTVYSSQLWIKASPERENFPMYRSASSSSSSSSIIK